jgi:hypothetical protein
MSPKRGGAFSRQLAGDDKIKQMFYSVLVLYYDRERLSMLTFALFTYRIAKWCDLLLTLAKGYLKSGAALAKTFARVPEHRGKT